MSLSVIKTIGDKLVSRDEFINFVFKHLILFVRNPDSSFELLNLTHQHETRIVKLKV